MLLKSNSTQGINMRFTTVSLICTVLLMTGCAKTQAIRTSADTMIISTSGAPACNMNGVMKVAHQMSAVETIKSGYDGFIVLDGASSDTVTTTQMPGSFHTTGYGSANTYGNHTSMNYNSTTRYQPGPTLYSGKRNVGFSIKMLKETDKGFEKSVPAREVLGENWQAIVEKGINTCS